MNNNQITKEELLELEQKLEHLILVRRKEVRERLQIARSYGDLSENSEYDAAKDEQAFLEQEIEALKEFIKNVTVVNVENISSDLVSIGKKVKLYFSDTRKREIYSLVGNGVDIFNNKISIYSPVGKAINHKKVRDQVIVEAPMGNYKVKILEIITK